MEGKRGRATDIDSSEEANKMQGNTAGDTDCLIEREHLVGEPEVPLVELDVDL